MQPFKRVAVAVATSREDRRSPRSGWAIRHQRWGRDIGAAYFNGLTGRTIETKYFGRRPEALNGADKLHRLSALGA
jgi:hypothetical protein